MGRAGLTEVPKKYAGGGIEKEKKKKGRIGFLDWTNKSGFPIIDTVSKRNGNGGAKIPMDRKMAKTKLFLFLGIAAAVLIGNHLLGWSGYLESAGLLEELRRMADESPAAAAAVYMAVTVVGSVVLALPGIAFAVLSGVLFGPVLGTIYCLAAATLGAMAAFLAGRYFLKDSIKPAISRNPQLKKWLFDSAGNRTLVVLMVTRLVPLFPYNLQNFAYGITDISFWQYSFWSFVFMFPGTAMYTFGAAGLADGTRRGLYLGSAVLFAAAAMGAGLYLKKKYLRMSRQPDGDCGLNSGKKTEPAALQRAREQCVHCHRCQENCLFLKKYGLDLGDVEQLEKLAYHCFLCGACLDVCPVGIDGRELFLEMRRSQVSENGGVCRERGYGFLLAEKENYWFQNQKSAKGKRILFPGCNFPSYYPKTTKRLAELWEQKTGMGVWFDCCGKPVAELGLQEKETQILDRLAARLREAGAEELVTVCPNCYSYLKDRLPVRVTGIYEVLDELGIQKGRLETGTMFLPCPDRREKEWFSSLLPFFSQPPKEARSIQCCGFGGGAGKKEPELAVQMAKAGREGQEPLYVYCASCGGSLTGGGDRQVRHCLSELLGVSETADTAHSWMNRAKMKFWRRER